MGRAGIGKTLDVGVCFSPNPHPEVIELKKSGVPLGIGVRPGHPLLKLKKSDLKKSISSFPCASPKAFAGIEVCEKHPALERAHIKSQVSFIFDSYPVVAAYLKKSEAWCFMPEILIESLGLESLNVTDLKANATISLIVPKGRPLPKPIEAELTESIANLKL